MKRRDLITACTAGLFAPLPALSAADTYPARPVKLIVPFPPGGPTDTIARLLAQNLQERWGQTVLVDYKPGAGTVIGVDYIAKAPADGYTIGMVNSSFAVNATLRKQLPYDTKKDLRGVTQLYNMQLAIVTHPNAPFNNLKELIAYAKTKPGKLNYGTPGAGSTTHLGAELLQREAGFTMQHIAMKGSAPAHVELMGGRLDLVVDPFLSILPFVESGKMKMIATMGKKRVEGHDFPTVSENIPGFDVGALLGFVVPSGTPMGVRERIQGDTRVALNTPEMHARAKEFGLQAVGSTPAEFDEFITAEMTRWGKVVIDAKIDPQ